MLATSILCCWISLSLRRKRCTTLQHLALLRYGIRLTERLRQETDIIWIINIVHDRRLLSAVRAPEPATTDHTKDEILRAIADPEDAKLIQAQATFLHDLNLDGVVYTLTAMPAEYLMSLPPIKELMLRRAARQDEASPQVPQVPATSIKRESDAE